jgi:hypothetical protein
MKKPQTIREVMNTHNLGPTEFSAKTGMFYNSCRNAHAPMIHFALEHGFDRRDYDE